MEDDFSDSGLLDIVRGLRDIEVDPDGPSINEEQQRNENIKLGDEDSDGLEEW